MNEKKIGFLLVNFEFTFVIFANSRGKYIQFDMSIVDRF